MAQQAMSVRTRAATPAKDEAELAEEKPLPAAPPASAMSAALSTTANLAKVLPTGTLVIHAVLSTVVFAVVAVKWMRTRTRRV